jgi:hypothetical protein
MTTFYCLRFETAPTWKARSPYLHFPRTGWPSYTPRLWVPFSSPATTRRATVEVFDPASTRVLSGSWVSLYIYIYIYIASARSVHKTPLPTPLFLLHACLCGHVTALSASEHYLMRCVESVGTITCTQSRPPAARKYLTLKRGHRHCELPSSSSS